MHLCFFFIFIFLPIISYTSTNFLVPGRALGFHRRDSRGDWYLYRRPSADDRRGFPKPGRCIKHNHYGVFPVGLTQDCGSPSFHCLFLFCVFFVYAINVMSPSLNVLESIKKKYQHIYLKKKFLLYDKLVIATRYHIFRTLTRYFVLFHPRRDFLKPDGDFKIWPRVDIIHGHVSITNEWERRSRKVNLRRVFPPELQSQPYKQLFYI